MSSFLSPIATEPDTREYWYRIEGRTYAPPADEYGECYGPGRDELELQKYEVLKHTPKGVWIHYGYDGQEKKFVNRETRKRFACPTKEEALESFIARKKRQKGIYEARAAQSQRFIDLANWELGTELRPFHYLLGRKKILTE